jgi:hypothetical protein
MIDQDNATQQTLHNLPTQVRRQVIQEGIVGTNLNKAPNPYSETPVTPFNFPPTHDERPQLHKVEPRELYVPRYNELYSSLRTRGDWRYAIDNYAIGQFTTIANTTLQVPVTLAIALDNKRLSQWPDAINLYLCLRAFALAPLVKVLATVVGLTVVFQDTGGLAIPIGATESDTPINSQTVILFTTPITDPGIMNIGTLLVKLEPTGTPATYDYMIGVSYAYLAATVEPYTSEKSVSSEQSHNGTY